MRSARILWLLTGFLLLFSRGAMAQYPIVSAEEVRTWMMGKRPVVLIDTRMFEEYQQAHLPGAISIPADTMKGEAAKLPKDKTTPIIFYCRGLGCTLSRMAAGSAVEMGYSSLMIYQAGMPDWLLKGYAVQKGNKPGKLK
jgi:rhodanese-related sulfurtransferase